MSMLHKVYIFNYSGFQSELAEILEKALTEEKTEELSQFVEKHITSLKDPYEGEPLDSDWREFLYTVDAHQIGDFALTKFYDPSEDIGLDYDWRQQSDRFEQLFDYDYYTLGKKFGPVGNRFDPGKFGSFFQSPEEVHERLLSFRQLLENSPDLAEELRRFENMLEIGATANQGLYITF